MARNCCRKRWARAAADFDNDGDQDLLLVNSCEWPWHRTVGKPPPRWPCIAMPATALLTT